MDNKQRIREEVASMIGTQQDDDVDIFSLGLVSSLSALQLVLFIEQEFRITVDGEDLDLDNFCSVDAMAAFVERKLASAAA